MRGEREENSRSPMLPEPPAELQARAVADAYRDLCASNGAFAKEVMSEAVRLGDCLIELQGGWLGAW